ncbi:GTP-binding protein [Rhodosporidiobolus nylandii]
MATTPAGKIIGPKQRKVALLGSRSVGKSSLTVQFVDSHFVDSYYPTIENTFQKIASADTLAFLLSLVSRCPGAGDEYVDDVGRCSTQVKYKGQEYALDIIDTAGQDEFSILSSRHAVGLHGWVLVYSVTSRASFEMCATIREKILDFTGRTHVPMVLAANKIDLPVQRQVTREEGAALAKEWGAAFIETSARTAENVPNIFAQVVAEVEKEMNPATEEQKKESGCVVA